MPPTPPFYPRISISQWHDDTHDATPSTAVGERGARGGRGTNGGYGGACSVFEIDPSRNQFHATFPGVGVYEGPLVDIFYFDRNRAEYPLYQGGDGGQNSGQSGHHIILRKC